MIRRIIVINEEKCVGCGACAHACHEGAIAMVEGKARLVKEHYCDGLGDCLPACPAAAISFEEREAPAYDHQAVMRSKEGASGLTNWPVQIRLAPVAAPYYFGRHLLIAADCTAYACGNFHRDFMDGRITLVGCPKLDPVDYSEKLTALFAQNRIRSVLFARMTVPCCGGLERAVRKAIAASGKDIPLTVRVIAPDGQIVQTEE